MRTSRVRWTTPVALMVTGGLLLLAAVLVWVLGAVTHLDGYRWGSGAEVVADGEVRAVAVDPGRETAVWVRQAGPRPDCTVADSEGDLGLRPVGTDYIRPGGSTGAWVVRATFDSDDDLVRVRCAATGTPSPVRVMVEPHPRLPPAFATVGSYAPWALVLGGLSLVVLLAVPLVVRREHARRPVAD